MGCTIPQCRTNHAWDLKMKETSTINRRDLLLGATPAATTLMILGAATTDSAIAQAATTAANYAPAFFTPVEWRFISAGGRPPHSKRRARPGRPGNRRA